MPYQFFSSGTRETRILLKKEEEKYLRAIALGAGTGELAKIKEKMLALQAQLNRSSSE